MIDYVPLNIVAIHGIYGMYILDSFEPQKQNYK